MEISVKYTDLVDRATKVTEQEATKLRMLSDTFDSDWKPGSEPHGTMVFTDYNPPSPPLEPPRSTHLAALVSVTLGSVRPAKVKRVWQGKAYYYDCFVSQMVKDGYVAGTIVIGDFLLVHFDTELNEQVVTEKIFKTW